MKSCQIVFDAVSVGESRLALSLPSGCRGAVWLRHFTLAQQSRPVTVRRLYRQLLSLHPRRCCCAQLWIFSCHESNSVRHATVQPDNVSGVVCSSWGEKTHKDMTVLLLCYQIFILKYANLEKDIFLFVSRNIPFAIDRHWPKTIKNTTVTHAFPPGDMFLPYQEPVPSCWQKYWQEQQPYIPKSFRNVYSYVCLSNSWEKTTTILEKKIIKAQHFKDLDLDFLYGLVPGCHRQGHRVWDIFFCFCFFMGFLFDSNANMKIISIIL